MFSFVPRRLLRAPVALPFLFSKPTCLIASHTSSSSSFSGTSSPLFSGVSTRSFSTSSLHLAGPFLPSLLCRQRGFLKGPSHSTGHHTSNGNSQPQEQLRLHGTVTAFKHRRGYGFVLAEGVVPHSSKPFYTFLDPLDKEGAAPAATIDDNTAAAKDSNSEEAAAAHDDVLHKTYFFTRAGLDGGFYVIEGERVSFTIAEVEPRLGTKRYLGAPAFNSASGSSSVDALTEDFSLDPAESTAPARDASDSASGPHKFRADAMRIYDLRTQTESPITPITLYGRVVEWDDTTGRGVIAELDMERQYHDDAPRFSVSLEDMDLARGTSMHVGRFVRFALGPAATNSKGSGSDTSGDDEGVASKDGGQLVAQRVIVDLTMERRRGAFGRPLIPATAAPGTVTDQTRFSGLVREIRGGRFGFIIDDLSGESIFFHSVNARANVKEGDRVTYLLRAMVQGKHAGKKACYDVRCAAGEGVVRHRESPPTPTAESVRRSEEEEGDEGVDLLEEEATAQNTVSASKAAKEKATATTGDAAGLDFDLL